MRTRVLGCVLFLAAAAAPAAAEDVPVTYTEAQAIEGAEVFLTNCARCHGIDLKGDFGPPLIGPPWDVHWRGGYARELFAFIRTNMPNDFPGTLAPWDYVAAMAFVLKANGIPAGTEPLTPMIPRNAVIPDYP